MDTFDLAIIGGGPAGYNAAERAGQHNLKTILFEVNKLGGVCLNEGCIPTKTMLHTSKLLDYGRDFSKYGLSADNIGFDYPAILKRKNKVVHTLVSGVGMKMKKHKVQVVNGFARLESRQDGQIIISSGDQAYAARNVLIATGASPVIPPIPGLDREQVLTSKEILDMENVPESLIVIGGGYIGMEFGGFYNTLGIKVTVIEMMDEICPGMDKEISGYLRKDLTKKGLNFNLKSKVVEIRGKQVIIEKEGKKETIEAEKILISVGRRPNIQGFGLENIGVMTDKGAIVTDQFGRTNVPQVYAAGDVNGKSLLAHTAYREGEVVINQIIGKKDQMRYHAIPGVIYTNPEVASVGMTEEMAILQQVDYEVKTLSMAYSGRFIAENEGKSGHCKMIIGKKYREILGVHMIGGACSEMIYGASMMLESEFRLQEMEEVVFPHPTVSEVIRETIFAFND